MKYHSLLGQFLTRSAKPFGDSAWQAVLVGRYPWQCHQSDGTAKPWRPTRAGETKKLSKQINLGGITDSYG